MNVKNKKINNLAFEHLKFQILNKKNKKIFKILKNINKMKINLRKNLIQIPNQKIKNKMKT